MVESWSGKARGSTQQSATAVLQLVGLQISPIGNNLKEYLGKRIRETVRDASRRCLGGICRIPRPRGSAHWRVSSWIWDLGAVVPLQVKRPPINQDCLILLSISAAYSHKTTGLQATKLQGCRTAGLCMDCKLQDWNLSFNSLVGTREPAYNVGVRN